MVNDFKGWLMAGVLYLTLMRPLAAIQKTAKY